MPMIIKCSLFAVTRPSTKLFHSSVTKFKSNNFKNADIDIDELPIFNSSQINNKCSETNLSKNLSKSQEKVKYLTTKIERVRKLFGNDNKYLNCLSHELPKGNPSPFHNGLPPIKAPQRAKRLSVTSLLTKSWCEIRFAYDIYSQVPRITTSELLLGLKQHSNLELISHPRNNTLLQFESDWNVPKDKLIDQWIQTMYRLVSLFVKGEAREIFCFAYIDSTDDKFSFVNDLPSVEWKEYIEKVNQINFEDYYHKSKNDQYILLSGVIDHLRLKSIVDNRKVTHSLYSLSEIQNPNYDIKLILDNIEDMLSRKELCIQVGDVKTRQKFNIPKQNSVIDSSKIQVMYYKKFLSNMGKDPSITYQSLLLNAFERGYNIDEPIHPLKIFSLILQNPFLMSDMEKLKQGKEIGFLQFDNYIKRNNTTNMDLTVYKDKFDGHLLKCLNSLCGIWDTPVTLRYLAARLSQLYYFIGKIISKNLLIEYYCRGVNFENLFFEYDESIFIAHHINSMQFWFGNRDIEPFTPNFYNFATFCKKCDYRDVCSWKKKGEDLCKKMGDSLSSLQNNS